MESQLSALVVDDDRSLRLLIRVNLELDGFGVVEAGTLAAAEAALAEGRPDVVLLDVHLGSEGSDGLLDRLRHERIPVLLVTGSADAELYRGRADEVLTKPFQPETLVAVARRLATVEA